MNRNSIAQAKSKTPPVRRERFVPVWDWELDEQSDLSWLVEGRLPEGGFGVLFGESGLYKTFIAIDLAYCVATGQPWAECSVRQGAVLYVAGEGSVGGLRRRAAAWRQAHDIQTAPVAFLPHAVALRPNHDDIQSLINLLNSMDPKPVLVVIDTLSRCLEGNENSADDMSKYVRAADMIREATGAFVLHIHHTPKRDPLTERGSNALRGAADVMIRVAGTPRNAELSCDKLRDGDDRWRYSARRIDVEGTGSGIVELTRKPDRYTNEMDQSAKPAEETVSQILAGFDGRTALSGELKAKAVKKGIAERTFYDLMKGLGERGVVHKTGKGKNTRYTATAESLQAAAQCSDPAMTAATAHPFRGAAHAVEPAGKITGIASSATDVLPNSRRSHRRPAQKRSVDGSLRTEDAYDDPEEAASWVN